MAINRRKNTKVEFAIELEYGKKTVEYLVRAEVSPFIPGRLSGPPEDCYPDEGNEVEVKEVWYYWQKKCDQFYFQDKFKAQHPPNCKCHGKMTVTAAERRPELDDLVTDDEVLENLPDDGPDEPECDDEG